MHELTVLRRGAGPAPKPESDQPGGACVLDTAASGPRESWAHRWGPRIYLLVALGGTGLLCVLLHGEFTRVVQGISLQGAELQAKSISTFRQVYTSEVVERAQAHGLEARADYQRNPDAIPLPATLVKVLDSVIAEGRRGARIRLYSDYPYPWRSPVSADDTFALEAIETLRRRPEAPFYRFETYEGRPSLRYAVADRMSQKCVDCHNGRPDDPKHDWKVGDMRGVLEVIRPMDDEGPVAAATARKRLSAYLIATFCALVTGICGLAHATRTRSRDSATSAAALDFAVATLREKEEMEQEQKRSIAELVAINEIHQQLFACRSATEIARVLADVLAEKFGAYFARVWLVGAGDRCSQCALAKSCTNNRQCLHLIASAGHYTHVDGDHRRVPLGAFKIGLIAQGRGKTVSNDVANDERIHNRAWAAEHGLTSFAGYPLVQNGSVVGVMAMFSKRKLTEASLDIIELLAQVGASALENVTTTESLARAQKLESIGQLAAGIAHEINTPTQFVGDNVRFLSDTLGTLTQAIELYRDAAADLDSSSPAARRLQDRLRELDVEFLREEAPKAIAQSLEGVERIARIVRAMKDFSHPGGEELSPADLNAAITSTLTVCHSRWKYVADMQTQLDEDLPHVPCLLAEFNQVMLNLIVNAADAIADRMGEGKLAKGLIRIETRRVDERAEIRVSDNGGGIPPEIANRIFDPFFTTKEVGKGTGQGLSISRNVIVVKHHGEITFETQPGVGTTFIIKLPVAAECDPAVSASGEISHD